MSTGVAPTERPCTGSERCMCGGFNPQTFRRLVCVDCFHGKSAHTAMATPNKTRRRLLAKSDSDANAGELDTAPFSPRSEDAVQQQRQEELIWKFLSWTREVITAAGQVDEQQGKRLKGCVDALEMDVMRYTEGKLTLGQLSFPKLDFSAIAAKNGPALSARSLLENMKKSPASVRGTRGSRRAHSTASHTEREARAAARSKKKNKRMSTALNASELHESLKGEDLEVLLEASKAKELVQKADPDKCVLTVLLPDSQFASVVLSKHERAVDALLRCCAKRGLDSSNYMLVDNDSGGMLPNSATSEQLKMCSMLSLKAKPKAVLRSDRKRLEKEMKNRSLAAKTARQDNSIEAVNAKDDTQITAPKRRPMQAHGDSVPPEAEGLVEERHVRRAQPVMRTVVVEEVNDAQLDSSGIDIDAAMAALENASSDDSSSNMFCSSSDEDDLKKPQSGDVTRLAQPEKSPRPSGSPRPSLFGLWGASGPEKSPQPPTNFGALLDGVDTMAALANLAPDRWTKLICDWGVVDEMNLKGLKRAKKKMSQNVDYEMQDVEHCAVPFAKNSNMALFSIFDGHAGKACAKQAAVILPKCIKKCMREQLSLGVELKDMRTVFMSAFAMAEESLSVHLYEGCTGTVALVWALGGKRYVQVANVGDSHAFLGRNAQAIQLTVEHKIGAASERARVEALGVFVEEGASRLSGLAVSRALGDYYLKQQGAGVSGVPSVSDVYPITGADQFLIVASDGLWDTITGQDALSVIHGNKEDRSAQQLCELLLAQALASPKCTDNISIAIANLRDD